MTEAMLQRANEAAKLDRTSMKMIDKWCHECSEWTTVVAGTTVCPCCKKEALQ